MASFFQVKMMEDTVYSCLDTNNIITKDNYCNSKLYNGFLENIHYVSQFGNSNQYNIEDWVEMRYKQLTVDAAGQKTYCPSGAIYFPVITFMVSQYGIKSNPQY